MHPPPQNHRFSRLLDQISHRVTLSAGSLWALFAALASILIWLAMGPVNRYSDSWQLVINTGTTIVTFVMVFLIQRTQNKDSLAIQLKLNEIVAALKGASNRLVDVESLTDEELNLMHERYIRLAQRAGLERDVRCSHSVEEDDRPDADSNQSPAAADAGVQERNGRVPAPSKSALRSAAEPKTSPGPGVA